MQRNATNDSSQAPGYDSFLDIATNIVGILIILVMVVGVQAKDAWIEAADQAASQSAEEKIDVATPREESAAIEADIRELAQKANRVKAESAAKFQRREQLQLLALAAQQALDQRRAELDEVARKEYDLRREAALARDELEDLKDQQRALEQSQGYIDVIEHLPTPMAKTVFGKEEHFRLLNGRLTYVPMNELVDHLRHEWQEKVWRLENVPQVTETIGPVNGFRMKYTLERKRVTVQTSAGPLVREMAGLARFVLVPVSDELGEPFRKALQPQSDFRRRLNSLNPETTTITVWCYPDGFDQFRELKRELFRLGFRTAGRPLPTGYPISGSPKGSRSAAE
jgi:hypothetical protein